jgi:transposase-like protein
MKRKLDLTAAGRDMPLQEITSLSAIQVVLLFSRLRWGSEDQQQCPVCAHTDDHWFSPEKMRWRCKKCHRDFTVTTRTIFHGHKLSINQIALVLYLFATRPKGIPALELSRTLECGYQTAWLFCHKLREVIIRSNVYTPAEGTLQMDGGYFCGKLHRPNVHKLVKDGDAIASKIYGQPVSMAAKRRYQVTARAHASRERKERRRTVFVLREVHDEKLLGAKRTMVYIARSENEKDALEFATKYAKEGSIMMTDESNAFVQLSRWFDHKTVVHSERFVDEDGTNDNQAESYFARMRRAEYGTFHGYRPKYLIDYAAEMAWREDVRTWSTRQKFEALGKLALTQGISRWHKGHYQGNKRRHEIFGPADGARFAA